jgi:hypothetical protein
MGEERKVYKVLVGKLAGKRPLGRPQRRWEDGIRMDLGEIGWRCVEWIQLVEGRDCWRTPVRTVINILVRTAQKTGNFLATWAPFGFSGWNLIDEVSLVQVWEIIFNLTPDGAIYTRK